MPLARDQGDFVVRSFSETDLTRISPAALPSDLAKPAIPTSKSLKEVLCGLIRGSKRSRSSNHSEISVSYLC
jgi:hypothetical protein